MKHSLIALAAVAALLCSCSASRKANDFQPEIHDIGYGSVSGDQNNYAVSKVKVAKSKVTYTNMLDYLRGTVPGLTVSSSGFITIRGIGSNNPQQPLFLVDGVEVDDISNIDPNIVANVEVLKDASSSIYGMRGGSGVIMITTRK